MLRLDSVREVLASSPRSRFVGFFFQCDLRFFTVICVTRRVSVCSQELDFLASGRVGFHARG